MPTAPPTWDLDTSGDFLAADGIETVHLRRQNADHSYQPPVPVRAVREPPDRRTAAGLMEAADVVFHLYAPDVGPAGVNRGDRLTDHAGAEWDAQGATLAGALDQWRVPCTLVPR